MMDLKEQYLYSALDIFKEMISNGECSKQDIAYFCGLSKYELDRRGASVGKKEWLTKDEASKMLGVSTSTFDRIVKNGGLPKGRKKRNSKVLIWKREQIEQCNRLMLLKSND